MANDESRRTAASGEPRGLDQAGAEWQIFDEEEREERTIRRVAIAVAIVIHALLVIIPLPALYSGVGPEQEEDKVFVVQQVRFRPPPPKQQEEIPKPKTKRVPIPDPTPDEPEPIRLEEEIEPEIDLPDTDAIFGIPEAPPTEPTGPIRVGGDVLPPERITGADPNYTEVARRARVEGVVILETIIDKQGNVTNVKILKGLPMGLDQAAVNAVKGWKFDPATQHGRPVAVYYTLTVNFQLN